MIALGSTEPMTPKEGEESEPEREKTVAEKEEEHPELVVKADRGNHHVCCIPGTLEIPEEEMLETFTHFDKDGSGKIDREELMQLMAEIYGKHEGEKQAEAMLKEDKDNDGAIS